MTIEYDPIGVIHTPFKSLEGMPIQPAGAKGARGTAELRPEYAAGLADLDSFSHVILLYHLHGSRGFELEVTPFVDSRRRGLFATRAPRRPNPIGLSIVELLSITGATVHVENVDILDGTPLLDIKPYVPEFDERPGASGGWLEQAKGVVRDTKSDGRFLSP